MLLIISEDPFVKNCARLQGNAFIAQTNGFLAITTELTEERVVRCDVEGRKTLTRRAETRS